MRIYILDDCIADAYVLQKMIQHHFDLNVPLSFVIESTGSQYLEAFDVYILDMDMPIAGISIAQKISDAFAHAKIVFYTLHNELVFDTFVLRPFFFIRKSHLEHDVLKFLALVQQDFQNNHILVHYNGRSNNVNVRDVLYVESVKNYVYLYTKDTYFVHRSTLKALKACLSDLFVACNSSILVNILYVDRIEADQVFLKNGKHIALSRHFKTSVLAAFKHIH